MQVIERKHPRGRSFEMRFDPENMLVLVMHNGEDPGLAIGTRLNGRWFFQWLMWSCRGGRKFWFRPLVAFYRHIRRNKLTDHSLRYLASGEHRLKHGGYVVGSEAHGHWLAACARLEAERQREAEVKDRMRRALPELAVRDRWRLEVCPNDFYVFNELTAAAGLPTGCINVKIAFDSIFVQQITGISTRANDPDPFRHMKRRNEGAMTRVSGETPVDKVDEAIREVQRLMAERSTTDYTALAA